ncbi:MAG: BTAD domain-containing putative transcriptional regulator [Pseudomonadota bacterium]
MCAASNPQPSAIDAWSEPTGDQPQPMAPDAYALRLVGPVRLFGPGRCEVSIPARKNRAIIALLALSPEATVTRARLGDVLWGDRGEAQARASVRQALHELRKAMDVAALADALIAARTTVSLAIDVLGVDAVADPAFLRTADPGAVEARLQSWQSDLMQDLDGVTPAFDEWLRDERLTRRDTFLEAATGVLQRTEDRSQRMQLARLIVQLDPTREEAHRLLMDDLRGDRRTGAAAAHYASLERLFQTEFGVAPDQATREVALGLGESPALPPIAETGAAALVAPAAATAPTAVSGAGRRSLRPHVLVSPFKTDGGEGGAAALASVLVDDLAFFLERSDEVDVIAGAVDDTDSVDVVLDGRLSSMGERVRIHLWLHAPDSPVRLWSERFDMAVGRATPLSDDATARMGAAALAGIIRHVAAQQAVSQERQAEAYRCFAKARDLVDIMPQRDRLRAAVELLTKAVETDPHNLIATVYLVRLLNTQLLETEVGADPAPARARALELAVRAYHLQPQSAAANFVIGWCHLRQRSFQEARWHIEQALELNPYHPERLTDAATAFMYLGDTERAAWSLDRAFQLDPRVLEQRWADALEIHLLKRDPESALAAATKLRAVDVKRSVWVGAAAAHAGDLDRAREAIRSALTLATDLWVGPEPFAPERLMPWLREHLPFARDDDRAYFEAGLGIAGLPV